MLPQVGGFWNGDRNNRFRIVNIRKLKKRLKKHIKEKNFVKVYIANSEGFTLTHFNGLIFDHNDEFILMGEVQDFNYDGFIVARKSDISEIKRTDDEVFYDSIIESEGLKADLIKKSNSLNFQLGSFVDMFEQIRTQEKSIIIDRLYETETKFHIGTIQNVEKKKVLVNSINAKGEYDLKPVMSKFKDITFFRMDSPYSNLFVKYSSNID
jgi:hypothetical protein